MAEGKGKGRGRIVVVDDDADTHLFLNDFLTQEGYVVASAYSWREAVTLLTQAPPDLIILDIMMPDINGYVIAETLKRDMEWTVPILFYSALDKPEDVLTGFGKGGNAYLSKPAPLDELRATIQYIIEERARERRPHS